MSLSVNDDINSFDLSTYFPNVVLVAQPKNKQSNYSNELNFHRKESGCITCTYTYSAAVSPDLTPITCGICYENKFDWVLINKCKHKLCHICYSKIVNYHLEKQSYDISDYNTIHYTNFIIKNSIIKCPFCRTEYSFLDTSHFHKSRLSLKVRDVLHKSRIHRNNKK